MLKLNQEYTYKKICEELGWKESSGGQKQKQIKEIESSFEFYHPENKKTHKPKKSYIFTKQLKEPELEDKRKTNSGVKRVPDGVFEYLFKCVLSSGVQRNEYHQRGEMTNIYISSSVIYREFGFDVYGILHSMALHFESATTAGYAKVSRIFQENALILSGARPLHAFAENLDIQPIVYRREYSEKKAGHLCILFQMMNYWKNIIFT